MKSIELDFQTQCDKGETSSYIPNGEWELLGRCDPPPPTSLFLNWSFYHVPLITVEEPLQLNSPNNFRLIINVFSLPQHQLL